MPKTLMYFGNLPFWGQNSQSFLAEPKTVHQQMYLPFKTQGHLGGIFCVSNVKGYKGDICIAFAEIFGPTHGFSISQK